MARHGNKTQRIIVKIHFDKYYSVYSGAIDTFNSVYTRLWQMAGGT